MTHAMDTLRVLAALHQAHSSWIVTLSVPVTTVILMSWNTGIVTARSMCDTICKMPRQMPLLLLLNVDQKRSKHVRMRDLSKPHPKLKNSKQVSLENSGTVNSAVIPCSEKTHPISVRFVKQNENGLLRSC